MLQSPANVKDKVIRNHLSGVLSQTGAISQGRFRLAHLLRWSRTWITGRLESTVWICKLSRPLLLATGWGKNLSQSLKITVTVNGREYQREVEPRLLLSDFLRQHLGLTGTHVGCEHGVCGACTVLLDQQAIRSCLLFAVQADGASVTTVEGLEPTPSGRLHPLQQAFQQAHALQCGFCTPGFLMTLLPFLEENPCPREQEIRLALSGNLCRCTGYQNIVKAVLLAVSNKN